ncbi:MAG TPA: hypothetical protein PK867_08915, partial [Pirellulales bacterium]|nr:hypothetical protein [Pirellulales bacterium]
SFQLTRSTKLPWRTRKITDRKMSGRSRESKIQNRKSKITTPPRFTVAAAVSKAELALPQPV